MTSVPVGGYGCEFIDQVLGDYYCKKCNLVARRLCVTSCCGEHYCLDCISSNMSESKPCPECGTVAFNVMELVKVQRNMASLRIHCTMKERGCKWSGMLEELEAHVNPSLENCQYIDTICPLNCQQPVPRIELSDHLSEKCIKRNYFCQFCSFSATYEEIVNIHMPKCSYVPLQCPNRCGVSGEREMMEDHVKNCRLAKVTCSFSFVGCHEEFKQQDFEEHIRENVRQHLLLTATTLNQKIQDQEMAVQKKIEDWQKSTKAMFEEIKGKLKICTESLTSQSQIVNKSADHLKEHEKRLEEAEEKYKRELAACQRKLEEQDCTYKCKLEEHEVMFKSVKEQMKLAVQELECAMQRKLEGQQNGIMAEVGQLTQKLQDCHKKCGSIDKLTHQLEDAKKKLEETDKEHAQELATYKKKLEDQEQVCKRKMDEYQAKLENQEKKLKELEELVQNRPFHPPPPHWHHPPPHPHHPHGRRGRHGWGGPP